MSILMIACGQSNNAEKKYLTRMKVAFEVVYSFDWSHLCCYVTWTLVDSFH